MPPLPRPPRRYLAAVEGARAVRERERLSLVRATISGAMMDDTQVRRWLLWRLWWRQWWWLLLRLPGGAAAASGWCRLALAVLPSLAWCAHSSSALRTSPATGARSAQQALQAVTQARPAQAGTLRPTHPLDDPAPARTNYAPSTHTL
jgi:hypothetical protein